LGLKFFKTAISNPNKGKLIYIVTSNSPFYTFFPHYKEKAGTIYMVPAFSFGFPSNNCGKMVFQYFGANFFAWVSVKQC